MTAVLITGALTGDLLEDSRQGVVRMKQTQKPYALTIVPLLTFGIFGVSVLAKFISNGRKL
jgi:hypothetical protein